MNIQDQYPYDSFLFGIRDQYMKFDSGSYYINLESILAEDSIISQGKQYVLIIVLNNVLNAFPVEVESVYIPDNRMVHITVLDDLNHRRIVIKHDFRSTKAPYWWLVEGRIMQEMVEKLEALEYCNGQ